MIIKVCGLVDQENHTALSVEGLDMIGINFYEPSKRYIADRELDKLDGQERVGVFVQATLDNIITARDHHQLDYAQLHGDESVAFCQAVQEVIKIIKVFRVSEDFDWEATGPYSFADYFLFDTYTKDYGGSGKRFDWSELSNYKGKTPFLLSGGIGPEDVERIKAVAHPKFVGVDINSGFESAPGIKNEEEVKHLISALKV